MEGLLGIPRSRIPVAIGLVVLLAFTLSWLQGKFDTTDVKRGITLALQHRTVANGPTVFEAIAARGEGDPRCDGKVVSTLLGDIEVRCATPGKPLVEYEFRVLLDGKRPPRASNAASEALVAQQAVSQ